MKVSVIIPCYNAEEYVSDCLDSVLKQTYGDIEIICVDNNSTDNTFAILKDYQSAHPEKISVHKEIKKGASSARNNGLSIARGEWIQFLDADDILLPNKVEHQVCIALDKKNLAMIVGGCTKVHVNGLKTQIVPSKNKWEALLTTRLGNTCANLFNKSYVDKVGQWNEELPSSQESDLMFRILASGGEVYFDDQFATIIYEKKDGISNSNVAENKVRYLELRLKIKDFLYKKGLLTPELKVCAYKSIFNSIRDVYRYNSKKACTYFENTVKNKAELQQIVSLPYFFFYKMVGFRETERIWLIKEKLFRKFKS